MLRWTRRGIFVCYGSASRHDPFSGLPPLVRLLLLRTSSSDYVHKLDCAFAPRCRPIFRTYGFNGGSTALNEVWWTLVSTVTDETPGLRPDLVCDDITSMRYDLPCRQWD